MGVYPDPFGRVHHAEGVQNWFGGNGMREHGADSIRNHFERVWREHKTMPNPNMRLPFGVNLGLVNTWALFVSPNMPQPWGHGLTWFKSYGWRSQTPRF